MKRVARAIANPQTVKDVVIVCAVTWAIALGIICAVSWWQA